MRFVRPPRDVVDVFANFPEDATHIIRHVCFASVTGSYRVRHAHRMPAIPYNGTHMGGIP